MSLIFYPLSLFGNLFVIRTLQIFRDRALLCTTTVTKTGTAYLCSSICISFFCAEKGFYGLLFLCLNVLLTLFMLFFFELRQIEALKSEVPVFLDRWLLNLRLGLALPTARETALQEHSERFQLLIRPLFAIENSLRPSRVQTHPLLQPALLNELASMHLEPHSALARIEFLRQMLRKRSEFRHKSGQATRQTFIQCSTMLCLTFALMGFTWHRYGWRRSLDFTAGTLFLSILGVTTMYLVSRKTKWKI